MQLPHRGWIVLSLSGAGVGAMAAKFNDVTSWPEAKLYISVGAAFGLLFCCILNLINRKK